MHYNSFDFLKVFNFERVGGSEKELEAANLLLEEMKRRGGEEDQWGGGEVGEVINC